MDRRRFWTALRALGDKQFSVELEAIRAELAKAQNELQAAERAFQNKRAQLDAAIKADQEDLFGERQSQQAGGMFDVRVDASAREDAIKPFREAVQKAKDKVNGLNQKLADQLNKGTQQMTMFSRLFHGSGHSFSKFSTDKIGTGEGRQAFGWGLYFTELEDVANWYARKLRKPAKRILLLNGIAVDNDENPALYRMGEWVFEGHLDQEHSPRSLRQAREMIEHIDQYGNVFSWAKSSEKQVQGVRTLLEHYLSGGAITAEWSYKQPKTQVYKVGLRKENPRWLSWYGDAAEVLTKVKEALGVQPWKGFSHSTDVRVVLEGKSYVYTYNPRVHNERIQYQRMQTEIGLDAYDSDNWETVSEEEFARVFEIGWHRFKVLEEMKNGKDLYEELAHILGSPKLASEFLLNLGYDGVRYPAESMTAGPISDDNARGFNYVVFDDQLVEMEQTVMFSRDGQVLGFVHDGEVYLNPDAVRADTPLHEIGGHVLANWARQNNPALYRKMLEVARQAPQSIIDHVRENYPDLQQPSDNPSDAWRGALEEKFWEEVFATTLGLDQRNVDRAEALAGQSLSEQVKQFIRDVWNSFYNFLVDQGIVRSTNTLNPEDFQDMTLSDFVNLVGERMFEGRRLAVPEVEDVRGLGSDYALLEASFHLFSPKDLKTNLFGKVVGVKERALKEIKDEMDLIERNARRDGRWMLAPNNRYSNLSPELWKLVRTKRFKQWFGDWRKDKAGASKILDENGEPKVYHSGSREGFEEFSKKYFYTGEGAMYYGAGFYFTPEKSTAESYSKQSVLNQSMKDLEKDGAQWGLDKVEGIVGGIPVKATPGNLSVTEAQIRKLLKIFEAHPKIEKALEQMDRKANPRAYERMKHFAEGMKYGTRMLGDVLKYIDYKRKDRIGGFVATDFRAEVQDKLDAAFYTMARQVEMKQQMGDGVGHVFSVFLNVRTPLHWEGKVTPRFMERVKAKLGDRYNANPKWEPTGGELYKYVAERLNEPMAPTKDVRQYTQTSNFFTELGVDGVVHTTHQDWQRGYYFQQKAGERQVIVFEPRNIKSVDNQGTFSAETNLIGFQRESQDPFVYDAYNNVVDVAPAVQRQIVEEKEAIQRQALASGTYLLAPDGLPTRLTEDQWLTTRTLRFQEWDKGSAQPIFESVLANAKGFMAPMLADLIHKGQGALVLQMMRDQMQSASEESGLRKTVGDEAVELLKAWDKGGQVIKDRSGDPQVVWAGGRVENQTFNFEKIGKQSGMADRGFSFTTNRRVAALYGDMTGRGGGYVRPFFIKAASVAEYDAQGKPFDEFEVWNGYKWARLWQMQDHHYEGWQWGDINFPKTEAMVVRNINEVSDGGREYLGDTYYIFKKGDEGISTQIKSASSNTTFSDEVGDVRFQRIGRDSRLTPIQLAHYEQAQQMANRGVKEGDIFLSTGWFRDTGDGHWRYELPNDNVKFNLVNPQTFAGLYWKYRNELFGMGNLHEHLAELPPHIADRMREVISTRSLPLGDILDYPELYEAHPELQAMPVKFHPKGVVPYSGQYVPSERMIQIQSQSPFGIYVTLRHEVQHALQHALGFESGANLDMGKLYYQQKVADVKRKLQSMDRNLSRLMRAFDAGDYSLESHIEAVERGQQGYRNELEELEKDPENWYELFYRQFAGEREAYGVERRLRLPDGLRVVTPPVQNSSRSAITAADNYAVKPTFAEAEVDARSQAENRYGREHLEFNADGSVSFDRITQLKQQLRRQWAALGSMGVMSDNVENFRRNLEIYKTLLQLASAYAQKYGQDFQKWVRDSEFLRAMGVRTYAELPKSLEQYFRSIFKMSADQLAITERAVDRTLRDPGASARDFARELKRVAQELAEAKPKPRVRVRVVDGRAEQVAEEERPERLFSGAPSVVMSAVDMGMSEDAFVAQMLETSGGTASQRVQQLWREAYRRGAQEWRDLKAAQAQVMQELSQKKSRVNGEVIGRVREFVRKLAQSPFADTPAFRRLAAETIQYVGVKTSEQKEVADGLVQSMGVRAATDALEAEAVATSPLAPMLAAAILQATRGKAGYEPIKARVVSAMADMTTRAAQSLQQTKMLHEMLGTLDAAGRVLFFTRLKNKLQDEMIHRVNNSVKMNNVFETIEEVQRGVVDRMHSDNPLKAKLERLLKNLKC